MLILLGVMNNRIMRLIVFFDLPTLTKQDIREYTKFRTFLLKNGFLMMQKSVYNRLLLNNNSSKLLKEQIIKNLPSSSGIIQLMQITEKQFSDIEYLAGNSKSKVLATTERVVQI